MAELAIKNWQAAKYRFETLDTLERIILEEIALLRFAWHRDRTLKFLAFWAGGAVLNAIIFG